MSILVNSAEYLDRAHRAIFGARGGFSAGIIPRILSARRNLAAIAAFSIRNYVSWNSDLAWKRDCCGA